MAFLWPFSLLGPPSGSQSMLAGTFWRKCKWCLHCTLSNQFSKKFAVWISFEMKAFWRNETPSSGTSAVIFRFRLFWGEVCCKVLVLHIFKFYSILVLLQANKGLFYHSLWLTFPAFVVDVSLLLTDLAHVSSPSKITLWVFPKFCGRSRMTQRTVRWLCSAFCLMLITVHSFRNLSDPISPASPHSDSFPPLDYSLSLDYTTISLRLYFSLVYPWPPGWVQDPEGGIKCRGAEGDSTTFLVRSKPMTSRNCPNKLPAQIQCGCFFLWCPLSFW